MSRPLLGPRRRVAALLAPVVLALVAALLLTPAGSPPAGSVPAAAGERAGLLASADARTPRSDQARARVRKAVVQARRGAPVPRRTTPTLAKLDGSREDLGRCDYGRSHHDTGGRLCLRGDRSGGRTVVVLGDSHGKHWVGGIQKVARKHGWKAYYLVKEQCTASIVANGDPDEAAPRTPWEACQEFREWAVSSTIELDPDLVVVSTSIPTKGVFTSRGYATTPAAMVGPYRRGFVKLFSRLTTRTEARVVLLRDVPGRKPRTDPLKCFPRRGVDLGDCLSPVDSQRSRVRLVDASEQAARSVAGVRVADPTPFFCWDGDCPASVGKGLLPYRNNAHITTQYSRALSGALAELLRMR